MKIEEIKITKAELDRIYEDFAAIDRGFGIAPKESERIELAVRESGEIAAYASGLLEYELFYISDLWVRGDIRHRQIGTSLLSSLEERARSAGCKQAYLWTAGEQNLSFYIANGYEQFVRFEDCFGVKGHHKYGLKKLL